jgi:hypothetical protein
MVSDETKQTQLDPQKAIKQLSLLQTALTQWADGDSFKENWIQSLLLDDINSIDDEEPIDIDQFKGKAPVPSNVIVIPQVIKKKEVRSLSQEELNEEPNWLPYVLLLLADPLNYSAGEIKSILGIKATHQKIGKYRFRAQGNIEAIKNSSDRFETIKKMFGKDWRNDIFQTKLKEALEQR